MPRASEARSIVLEHHLRAAVCQHLRDAGAHQAGAEHADARHRARRLGELARPPLDGVGERWLTPAVSRAWKPAAERRLEGVGSSARLGQQILDSNDDRRRGS